MLSSSWLEILCSPNEDFGRRNKRWNADVRHTFQGCEYSIWATNHCKVRRTSAFHLLFRLPKSSFGEHKFIPPKRRFWNVWQTMTSGCPTKTKRFKTKRLEWVTKDEMGIDALFKGVSTQFGPWDIEKCFLRNPHFIFCSDFQNLRLGSMKLSWALHLPLPKEDYGRPNQLFRMRFPGKHFSRAWVPDLGYESLKLLPLETHSERLVRPSIIFVWGAWHCDEQKVAPSGLVYKSNKTHETRR